MHNNLTTIGICEHRLVFLNHAEQAYLGSDGDLLKPLGGFQRTKESTIGALGNVGGGAVALLKGKIVGGPLQIAQGVFDALDTIPSAVADGVRGVMGTQSGNYGSSRTNIGRAFSHVGDIDLSDPVETIKDTIAVTTDAVHAVVFKPLSDVLRLARGSKSLAA
jgi:hypothetical protein